MRTKLNIMICTCLNWLNVFATVLGKINVAVVEASDVTEDGEIVPTCGVGITPTICRLADKIIVELKQKTSKRNQGYARYL